MLRLEKMNAYCVCGLHRACECGKFYLTVSLEKYILYRFTCGHKKNGFKNHP